jgi:hypothetical protein
MPCTDSRSRKHKRFPDFVTEGFQISLRPGECQIEELRHVLTQNPTGPDDFNNAAHLRPEVAVIVRSSLASGNRKGLAGESSGNNINCRCIGEGADVSIARHSRPVFRQHLDAVRLNLTEPARLESRPPETQVHAPDAGKE